MSVFQKKYLLIAAFLIVQGLVGITGGLALTSTPRENIILPGVFISGVKVGGYSREQAIRLLEMKIAERPNTGYITLHYGDKKWLLPYTLLSAKINIPASVDRALAVGRERPSFFSSLAMFQVRYRKPDLALVYTLDETELKRALSRIAAEIDIPPRNAGIIIDGTRLSVTREVPGKTLNLAASIEKIKKSLGAIQSLPVDLEVSQTAPQITVSDLKGIREQLGIGIVSYPGYEEEVAENVVLAVRQLNGKLIRPGETFSFNRMIRPVVLQQGLQEAPVITRGHLAGCATEEICRIATAMYQALLYSGFEISERHAHAALPPYVAPGQDAVVADGLYDLKFENTGMSPIYIDASVKNNRIVIKLFGRRKTGETIQLDTEEAKPARRSSAAVHINVYRVYYTNGVKVRTELVSGDDYTKVP